MNSINNTNSTIINQVIGKQNIEFNIAKILEFDDKLFVLLEKELKKERFLEEQVQSIFSVIEEIRNEFKQKDSPDKLTFNEAIKRLNMVNISYTFCDNLKKIVEALF